MAFPTKGLYLHIAYVNLIFAQLSLSEALDGEQGKGFAVHFHFGSFLVAPVLPLKKPLLSVFAQSIATNAEIGAHHAMAWDQ